MLICRSVRLSLGLSLALLGMLILPGSASAASQVFQSVEPFNFFIYCANGGAGEVLRGDLSVHIVRMEDAGSEGGVSGFWMQIHGVAVGDDSGAVYRVSERLGFHVAGSPGAATSVMLPTTGRFIGQGKAEDFQGKILFHVTANGNGVVTSEIDLLSITCD